MATRDPRTQAEPEADGAGAEMPEELNPRHLRRRVIELAALGAVVALLVSKLPGLGDLRDRFADADGSLIALAGVLELASCLAYVVAFRDVFCRRLPWGFSIDLAFAEQGTNVLVPTGGAGGLALGAWALRQGGMPTDYLARRSVAFFVFTSIPNFVCAALGGVLLAAHILPGSGPVSVTLTLATLAALAMVFVAALPRLVGFIRVRHDAGRLRRVLHKSLTALADGVRDTKTLLWPPQPIAVAGAIGYMAFDVAALAVAFAAFGSPPPFGAFLFAYVIGQLGGLIPVPGGIGGTDGGLIGALVLYGSPTSQAAAAVLAYRVFQLGLPAIFGTIGFTRMRRTLTRSPAPAALCAPLGEPLPLVTIPRRPAA